MTDNQTPITKHKTPNNQTKKWFGRLDIGIWNLFGIWILGFGILMQCCYGEPFHKDTQLLMGTFAEVTSDDPRAAKIVFDEIKRIEKLMSKYDEQSEIYALNKNSQAKVSQETFDLLKKSVWFSKITRGAFDITVGPIVKLWGFSDKKYRKPKNEEIKQALKLVGSKKLIFNLKDNVVKLTVPGASVDLGGIAKGYAIDCAVEKLKEAGIKSCLINLGGQVYGLGDKAGIPWEVAIQKPRSKKYIKRLQLKDRGISTSGDYEQFFILDGVRYTHIFDPRTGRPAQNNILSVSVVSENALEADALSTAIFVLGKKPAAELLKEFPNAQVNIIEEKDVHHIGK
ncbi:MAG: FAD:protein FMN transferase [Candidatus Omnitrophica bacterium]|jgi:thiamine biosynthesis lipoprotein|nr:FAD:protein FMN transferase [Candidatus Omnitrophota bacterium]